MSSISAPDDSRNGVRRSALRTSLKNVLPHHHVNSPLALPKSTSLSFRVMTPPFSEHFHLFFECDTLSNCARIRFPVLTSTPCAPCKASSSSLSELKVSPFSAGAASVAGPGFPVAAAVDFAPSPRAVAGGGLGGFRVLLLGLGRGGRVRAVHIPRLSLDAFLLRRLGRLGRRNVWRLLFALLLLGFHAVGIQSPAAHQLVLPELRAERGKRRSGTFGDET